MTGSAWAGVDLGSLRTIVDEGRLQLQMRFGRNLLGGRPLIYVETIDPVYPRRKPVAVLPGPLLPFEGGTHSDLLRLLADVLDGTISTVPFVSPGSFSEGPETTDPENPW